MCAIVHSSSPSLYPGSPFKRRAQHSNARPLNAWGHHLDIWAYQLSTWPHHWAGQGHRLWFVTGSHITNWSLMNGTKTVLVAQQVKTGRGAAAAGGTTAARGMLQSGPRGMISDYQENGWCREVKRGLRLWPGPQKKRPPPPVRVHCTRHSRACPVPNCPVPFPPCLPQCQRGPHLVPTNTWKMHEFTQRRKQLSHKTFPHRLGGNVCPARARRATFLLTIRTSAPGLPSHGEAPQVDHIALHTFPTKHVA